MKNNWVTWFEGKGELPLEIFADDEGRWLLVMFDDEHVAVGRCSPFGIASPDGDAFDAIDEAPLRIAVVKADVGVWLQFGVMEPLAFQNVAQTGVAAILSIVSCQPSSVTKFFFPLI